MVGGGFQLSFFHVVASARKRHNEIKCLHREDDTHATSQEDLAATAKSYFDDLFKYQATNFKPILDVMPTMITMEDNDVLVQPFTMEEFSCALAEMHKDKAPGPDGLNPGFYKRFWHLCDDEVFYASQT